MSYAAIGDIRARLPSRPFNTTSKPTQAEVEAWISEAEAMLNNALAGAGMPAPYTDATAILILKTWVCEYVEGRARMAHASTGGDGSNDDGKDLVDRFFGRISDIAINGVRYDRMLDPGTTASTTSRIRASNLDGAAEPVFTRDEVF